jgi:hypothetical protein
MKLIMPEVSSRNRCKTCVSGSVGHYQKANCNVNPLDRPVRGYRERQRAESLGDLTAVSVRSKFFAT